MHKRNQNYLGVSNINEDPELYRQYEQDAQKERDLKREFNDVENYLNEKKIKRYYAYDINLNNNRTKLESVSNAPDWKSMTNAGQNKKIDGWFIASGERAVKYLTDDEYKFRSNLAASAGGQAAEKQKALAEKIIEGQQLSDEVRVEENIENDSHGAIKKIIGKI